MAKPTPSRALPPFEYLELFNRSHEIITLKSCIIAVNKRDIILPDVALPPAQLLLVCPAAAKDSFQAPLVLGIDKWPAIPDDTGTIVFYNQQRNIIHAVSYNKSWYGSTDYSKGGYSLEMIDATVPCIDKPNWMAGAASAGGTPGLPNAAARKLENISGPVLYYIAAADSSHIQLYFSQTLDSMAAASPERYLIEQPALGLARPLKVEIQAPLFNAALLTCNPPLKPGLEYNITVNGLDNCLGLRGTKVVQSFQLPDPIKPGQIFFSEILFDPGGSTPGFIEIYNNGTHAVNLQSLKIQNIRGDGRTDIPKLLSTNGRLLMPGRCIAFTADALQLCNRYNCKEPGAIQELNMPLTYVGGGGLRLLTADSTMLEEIWYNGDWQFSLFSNSKGISLERISFERPAANADNWQSSTAATGYASPGWMNQVSPDSTETVEVTCSTPVFTPGNTDNLQLAKCRYMLGNQLWVANVIVYDVTGRPIRSIARNLPLSGTGFFTWDGYDEKKVLLPAGVYIFFIEIFNPQGRIRRWKQPVVLARKLN
ncbi:hypothetical protein ACE38W_11015 [Chitinophaga sp. Hz27]|uniref:hypothetical protein n=1 Tax=Chitinophaga sp. Hz27 TaxID=3347169 RepID=UPI0035DE2689